MSEDIKPEIIKRTQDCLNKFVKKPPLTEKLLRKPPFRFLHDLISSIMRETGFLQGLYNTEEMISDNIKDKDAKVAYLEKLILAVKLATGANVSARPTKIVAGLEVEKTNELLQAIGKALEKKIDSRNAVEQVLNKGSKKTTGTNKSNKQATSKSKQTKEIANEENKADKSKKNPTKSNKEVNLKDAKENKKTKKTEGNTVPKKKEKKESPARKTEPSPVKSKSTIRHTLSKERNDRQNSLENDKLKGNTSVPSSLKTSDIIKEKDERPEVLDLKTEDASLPNGLSNKDVKNESNAIEDNQSIDKQVDNLPPKANNEKSIDKQVDNSSLKANNEKEDQKGNIIREVEVRPESKRPGSAHPGHRKHLSSAHRRSFDSQVDDHSENSSEAAQNLNKAQSVDSSTIMPNEKENVNIKEATVLGGSSPSQSPAKVISKPMPRPRTATRPPSARPGAPRVRDRGHVQVTEEVSRSPSAVANVIVDSGPNNEEDIDEGNMVVVEPQQPILEASDLSKEQVGDTKQAEEFGNNNLKNEEQGQLVAQILETQRELEVSGHSSSKIEIDWEGGRKRERESTTKEVERLRSAIQSLTRAANPLGKLIDFLQEDVDSMQREYASWREAYTKSMAELKNEQSLTDASLEPLKMQLGELELLIQDELEKICAVKANILRNDERIQRLLTGSKS